MAGKFIEKIELLIAAAPHVSLDVPTPPRLQSFCFDSFTSARIYFSFLVRPCWEWRRTSVFRVISASYVTKKVRSWVGFRRAACLPSNQRRGAIMQIALQTMKTECSACLNNYSDLFERGKQNRPHTKEGAEIFGEPAWAEIRFFVDLLSTQRLVHLSWIPIALQQNRRRIFWANVISITSVNWQLTCCSGGCCVCSFACFEIEIALSSQN